MSTPATTLSEQLFAQLQGEPLQRIASQLGTDTQQAGAAVGTALPLLLGTLGRNAAQPQGAQALLGALQRDHASPAAAAASPLGGLDLGGLLGSLLGGAASGTAGTPARSTGPSLDDGAAILGHIFGGQQQQRAETGLGQATGLGQGGAANLLKILAPIVMSFLAQRVNSQGLDSGGLGNVLGQEQARARQSGGQGGDLLSAVLDQDGDGKVDLGDLLKLGGSLLGGRR